MACNRHNPVTRALLDPEPKHAWREIAVILNDEKMPFTVLVREGSVQMLVLQWIASLHMGAGARCNCS
jgi:hypothetical protein